MQSFDAAELLKFYNPEKGAISCVGYAPSKGRRCQNRIAAANVGSGQRLAKTVPNLVFDTKHLESTLYDMASCMLCRAYHQGQAQDMVNKWHPVIQQAVKTRQVAAEKAVIKARSENAWAAAMLAHAQQDVRPATLKHEDSGYASDDPTLFDDDNNCDSDHEEMSSLPQSSPKAVKTVQGASRIFQPTVDKPPTPAFIAKAVDKNTAVATSASKAQNLGTQATVHPKVATEPSRLPTATAAANSAIQHDIMDDQKVLLRAQDILDQAQDALEQARIDSAQAEEVLNQARNNSAQVRDISTQTQTISTQTRDVSTQTLPEIEIARIDNVGTKSVTSTPSHGVDIWHLKAKTQGKDVVFLICMAFVLDVLLRIT